MDDFGVLISNDQSQVQIDAGYTNYQITQSGEVGNGEVVRFAGTNDQSNLVFCRSTVDGGYATRKVPWPGGQWPGFGPWPEGGNYFVPVVTAGRVEYLVASRVSAANAPKVGWGIFIGDSAGSGVYATSDKRALRIVANLMVPLSGAVQTFTVRAPRAGKKYYAMINSLFGTRFVHDPNWARTAIYSFGVAFPTPTQIQVNSFVFSEHWSGSVAATAEPIDGHMVNILIAEF